MSYLKSGLGMTRRISGNYKAGRWKTHNYHALGKIPRMKKISSKANLELFGSVSETPKYTLFIWGRIKVGLIYSYFLKKLLRSHWYKFSIKPVFLNQSKGWKVKNNLIKHILEILVNIEKLSSQRRLYLL